MEWSLEPLGLARTVRGSSPPVPLFTTGQAITALALAQRLAAGYGDDDPFVESWRAELSR